MLKTVHKAKKNHREYLFLVRELFWVWDLILD
jgi:hypothetical protein